MSSKFAYVAFDRAGASVPGVVDAVGEAEAREMLRHKGLFVTKVAELTNHDAAPASTSSKRVGRGRALKNLTNFTRQLHVLIGSGTPLVQALGALERQSKDLKFREVLADVR